MSAPAMARVEAAAAWKDRRVVVVGAGRSGVAAAHLLLDCGAQVTVTDLRPLDELAEATTLRARGAALASGAHPQELWKAADVAVMSPGIPPTAAVIGEATAAGIRIVSEIEVAAAFIDAPIVAITGSNGKSTVTSMVGECFAAAGCTAAVCGNIGTALSTAVRRELAEGVRLDAYVVEVSSFQAQTIERFRPRVAAILNLQADHLDWHGSMENYAAAKLRLAKNMRADDWLVYNRDDEQVAVRVPAGPMRLCPFGMSDAPDAPAAAWIDAETLWWRPQAGAPQQILKLDDLQVIGRHNRLNAAAAAALACLAGLRPEAVGAGLRRFRALEHRMEPCGRINGVAFVNDSKATNADATAAALSGFDNGVWLILGGRDKGADFSALLPRLGGPVERVLLIGEAAAAIDAALVSFPNREICGTLEAAVDRALAGAGRGDTVLLSPACTSFDQFADFEARGRRFKALAAARGAVADEPPAIPEPDTETS